MSDYALLVVPTKGVSNENACMVRIESRHVSKVPQQGNEEIAFDTGLDPTMFVDHVSAAGSITKLIANGRHYENVRNLICRHLSELDALITDIRADRMPALTEETIDILFDAVVERIRNIGNAVRFKIEHEEGK